MQAGLDFPEIDGPDGEPVKILLLRHVPYALQDIVSRWIGALPDDLRVGLVDDDKFTEIGGSAFVTSRMDTLDAAQCKPDFDACAQALVIAQRD